MKLFSAFAAFAAMCAVFVSGCDKTPSESVIRTTAEGIGRAAGYALPYAATKPEIKDAVVKIIDVVAKVVPEEGQAFVEAWKPLIDDEVAKLVKAGKLREADAGIVKSVLYVVCDGIDLVFTRYPKAREYKNLVSAAVGGFVDGFKSVVGLTDGARENYDKEAYEIFVKKLGTK